MADREHHSQPASDEDIARVTIGTPTRIDGTIHLAEFTSQWTVLFKREAARVRSALGRRALRIEHVGSTAVPGLMAKPIIDIVLVVEDSGAESTYVPLMERAGYVLRVREPEWLEHRMFNGPDTCTNIHAFSRGCDEVERMVAFRDWLCTNGADRELYARTKQQLAAKTWRYVQNYADAKAAVVRQIMTRARRSAAAEPTGVS